MTICKVNHYIEVNENQPLELIVKKLESIGFKLTFKLTENPRYITIGEYKNYGFLDFKPVSLHDEISLLELLLTVRFYEIILSNEKCQY